VDVHGNFRSSLDVISFQILLQLSSKQALTIPEIAEAIDQSADSVYSKVVALERNHFVEGKNGKLKISREGMALVFEKGKQLPKPAQSTQPKESDASQRIMLLPILVLLLLLLALSFLVIIIIKNPQISTIIASVVLAAIIVFYIIKSFQRVSEYERIVVFRMGKCIGAGGPGLVLLLPIIDRLIPVDLRVKHQEVPHETCITQDNVQIDVDFVFYWKIQQPVWSVTKITDAEESIRLLATALLRAVIAHFPFNDVLNKRESINDLLKDKIDEISSEWGVYVTTMEIREIKPPEEIVKSMHKQREAEWLRQAIVINAEAQAEALKLLYEIATLIDDKTLNLKYFEMLRDLGQGEATKYIFPLELTNLIRPLIHAYESGKGPSETVVNKPEGAKQEQPQNPSNLLKEGS
jgi:regulator of protease activity HflC (stomatin/prohibitin superfamily)